MHKNLKNALNKVQDFVADPKVNNVAKIAKGMIDLGAQLTQAHLNGPVAIAGAILGSLHVIQEAVGAEPTTPHDVYVDECRERDKLVGVRTSIPGLLMGTGAIAMIEHKVVVSDKIRQTYRIEDGKGGYMLFVVHSHSQIPDNYMYLGNDFQMDVLRTAFWSCIGGPIAKMDATPKGVVAITGTPYGTVEYKGKHSPSKFHEAILVYQKRNISRGALFHGPPGTGKTSFVRAFAKLTEGRVLVIPPAFLNGSVRNEIEVFVDLLRPEVLLLDDIDRATGGLEYAMSLVEDLRRVYPQMVVISTVNRITKTNAGLLRPGRLGERVEFLAPSEDEKLVLLSYYLGVYGVDDSKLNLEKLVALMHHEDFSHDYVRFIAEQAVTMNERQLVSSIIDTNRYLCLIAGMEPDTNDSIKQLNESPASSPEGSC